MFHSRFFRYFVLTCVAWLAACNADRPDTLENGNTASVVLAITTVPTDVACIEVTVTGSQTTTQRFDVTSNQSASLAVTGLSTGASTINESAFSVACNLVTATTLPTWVAQVPASVTLIPGQTSNVTIVLVRPSQIQITNDFQDTAAATFALSPSPLSFGNVTVGSSGGAVLTLTNTGSTSTAAPMVNFSGTDAALFSVVPVSGADCTAGSTTLAAGAACNMHVYFLPTSTGTKSATLNLGSIGLGTPLGSVALTGVGVAATASLYCGTAPITDLGTLTGGNSPPVNVSSSNTTCYRFTVTSISALLHGIQASNCSGRDVSINGTLVCPQGTCSSSVSSARATDGYWYVLFSGGTPACSSSWWWY